MAKKQTAGGGRSTSTRKSPKSRAESKSKDPRAARTTSDKNTSARQKPRPEPSRKAGPASAPRASRAKNSSEKPRVRKLARPAIGKRTSFSQRLVKRLATVGKTLQNPEFWRRSGPTLPPWTDEVVAILLVVAGVVMLTALLNTTSEAVLAVNLSHILRQICGYGAYVVSLSVMLGGLIILLPKFGVTIRFSSVRIVAIEVAFGAFTALLHLAANDPQPRALAREGGGGGYLGWALTQFTFGLGNLISITLFAALFAASLILASGLRVRHVVFGVTWVRGRLQHSINHLDSLSFEPEYEPDFEPEDQAYPDETADHNADPPALDYAAPRPRQPVPPAAGRPSIVPRDDRESGSPSTREPNSRGSNPGAHPDANFRNGSAPRAGNTADPQSQSARRPSGNGRVPPGDPRSGKAVQPENSSYINGTNGRSLVAPGGPGERSSVVPRDLLPDARVIPDAPRARARRKGNDSSERYFTVDDFREVKKVGKRDNNLPPLDLLSDIELDKPTEEEINTNARIIKNTLLEFDVETEVIDVKVGPTVTQYAVSPYTEQVNDEGETVLNRVRVSQIANLSGDLALALSAKRLRVQAPVPGHSYVGVEVPNRQPSTVALRPVLESENFYRYRNSSLALPLGRDVSGEAFIADLATMPHLLIAGTTGSGKSIMLAAMTTAFVMNNLPDRVKLILLDPKMVELRRFNGLPHLLGPVESDLDRIIGVLRWVTREMDRRYKLLEKEAARNIDTFNKALGRRRKAEQLPYIVVIVDEIGDLMMQRPDETERALTRLAQMARAVGIHLMVATQRPSVDVITGLIKANFPARVSFAVASGIDSRVILDGTGAETLMGRGDMLFLAPDASGPQRIQGCYISDEEVNSVVHYWRKWHAAQVEVGRMEPQGVAPWERGMTRREVLAETDPMLEDAIALVIAEGEASASLIQRRLGLGYPRAARIVDLMHELGIVGAPRPGGRTREVLVKPGADPFKNLIDKRLKNKE
jgi:DNA segregation ATPase FtsK/SpoIIIE-like protein